MSRQKGTRQSLILLVIDKQSKAKGIYGTYSISPLKCGVVFHQSHSCVYQYVIVPHMYLGISLKTVTVYKQK